MWIHLLAVLPLSLTAQQDTVLIRFGTGQNAPADWSGSIVPAPAKIAPWQFGEGDSLSASSWKCATRRETYWDTPYERSMKGTSRKEKLTGKGIVLSYTDPNTEYRVTTAQGEFRFRPSAGRQAFLGGAASIEPAATSEAITGGAEAEDHPSLLTAQDGGLLLAYTRYEGRGDQVYAKRFRAGRWSDAEPLATPGGDYFGTALANGPGGPWVIWSANAGGNFDLYGRRWNGSQWEAEQRLTSGPGSDIYHAVATDKAGRLHLAWMSGRAGNFDIYTRFFDGKRWSAETRISTSNGNDWEPSIAASPDGAVTIVWDSYDGASYDLFARTLRNGTWSAATPVVRSGAFEGRASAAYDSKGALWIAYEEGDWNWGKDYGQEIVENGRGLLVRRQTRLVQWVNGRVSEPVQPLSAALPADLQQVMLAPRLMFDGGQIPWILFRYRVNAPQRGAGESTGRALWRQAASFYAGGQWSPAIEFPEGFGRIDAPAAVAVHDGRLHAVWTSDGRLFPAAAPKEQNLYFAKLPPAAAATPQLQAFVPSSENLAPSHAKEAADVARIRDYRANVGGRQLRIVRGDVHRHTDISWDGNRDGSLHDAYRYALDAVAFDYLGVCDHQAGNMIPYSWWMIQKAVDLFSLSGKFAPLYSYERSLPYPNGHRNVLFAERGKPVLAISPAEQKGVEGAGKLYEYLRLHKGLTTSHTSATGAGTDWRDSSEDLEPVVEIYQGYRRNYEGEGTPRSPAKGEEPSKFAPGYVWNAWAKGIRMGVQSSSDHVSTHISYAALYVDRVDRDAILDAIRARRTYAATDNIVVDFRIGAHFMGEAFASSGPQTLTTVVAGTGPIAQIQVIKNNRIVYTAPGTGSEMRFSYTDKDVDGQTAWYYVRVEQKDGQLAWSSPIWVTR